MRIFHPDCPTAVDRTHYLEMFQWRSNKLIEYNESQGSKNSAKLCAFKDNFVFSGGQIYVVPLAIFRLVTK